MHTQMITYKHVCVKYMYVHSYSYLCIHKYIHTYIYVHIFKVTHTYIHTHTHTHTRTHAHTLIHIHTHIYILTYIHTYIHTYTLTYKTLVGTGPVYNSHLSNSSPGELLHAKAQNGRRRICAQVERFAECQRHDAWDIPALRQLQERYRIT